MVHEGGCELNIYQRRSPCFKSPSKIRHARCFFAADKSFLMTGTFLVGGLPFVCWGSDDAKLPHHAQVISHRPVFDAFAFPKAYEMHLFLLK